MRTGASGLHLLLQLAAAEGLRAVLGGGAGGATKARPGVGAGTTGQDSQLTALSLRLGEESNDGTPPPFQHPRSSP